MQFFKHYHNSDSSTFVQKVIKEHGLLGYAHWNLLLELMCGKFNGDSILIQLTVPEIAQKLRVKPARVHSIISSFSELGNNQVITKLESSNNQDNFDGFIIIISAPILVDLQDRDFKYTRSLRADSDAKNKIKNKNKNKIKKEEKNAPVEKLSPEAEALHNEITKPFLQKVNSKTIETWTKKYSDQKWVLLELIAAIEWIFNNPNKAPKSNYGTFFSGWLKRGWENHRKKLPSVSSDQTYGLKAGSMRDYVQGMMDSFNASEAANG